MAKRNIIDSFNSAIEGFIYVVKTQRNMRIHFTIATLVLLFGLYVNLTGRELLLLCSAITFVLLAEMVNTAVELTVDLIHQAYHPLARIVKDVSAGAVFVSSINAIATGCILFSTHMNVDPEVTLIKIKESPWYFTFLILIIVFAIVVAGKILLQKGKPLRGGMPSGHAAVSFAMWTIITFITRNTFIMLATLLLAILVARSRMSEKIHTFWEVLAGAVLGVLVALLVFQLLR